MSLSSVAIVLMAAAIVYLGRKSIRKNNLFINCTLGLMLGGGIGNMIDRFLNITAQPGKYGESAKVVVDFIQFDFFKQFPIFNLADSFISIGSVLFCIFLFMGKYKLNDVVEESDCQPPSSADDTPFTEGGKEDSL